MNILKADAAWRDDRGYYIPAGRSDHIAGLLRNNVGKKVNMPHVGYWKGALTFTDGRHRFAWCRDNGVKHMPLTVNGRKQVELVRKLCGTLLAACAVFDVTHCSRRISRYKPN